MKRLLAACAALLLAPLIATAGERTGVIDVRGKRVELPLPDGYVQASLDMPEWLELAKSFAPARSTVEEVVLHAECMSDPDELYCPAAFEFVSLPMRVTPAQWRVLRETMLKELAGDTSEMQAKAMQRSQEKLDAYGEDADVKFTRAATPRVVVVAADDPRTVRFYLPAPGRIEADGAVAEQLRVVAQMAVDGQVLLISITRDFPEGKATPEAHRALVDELDAYLTGLFARNTMTGEPPAK